jgi:hypothetical protein
MMKGTITSMRADGRGIWQERVNGGQVLAKRAVRPKHHKEGSAVCLSNRCAVEDLWAALPFKYRNPFILLWIMLSTLE